MVFKKILSPMFFVLSVWILLCVDAIAGSVAFDVVLNPVGDFTARANTLAGSAMKKGDVVMAKNIRFKLSDLQSGVELRDTHMKEKYLEVEKFPTAELVAAKGENGKFKAILKIRGKSNPVSGSYKISGSELTANFKTTLSAWGIPEASYMGVSVEDEVTVTVTLPVK